MIIYTYLKGGNKMKEYKTVSLGQMIIREKNDDRSVATHVEEIINEVAKDGWQYHSMETITQADKGGCLSFGKVDPNSQVSFYVVIFEREI